MHGERTQAYGDANTNTGEHTQRYVARTKVRLQVPHTFQESSVTQQVVSAFYYEYQICGRAHSLTLPCTSSNSYAAITLAFVSLRHISV